MTGDTDGPDGLDPLLEIFRVARGLGASRIEVWDGPQPWVSVRFPGGDVASAHRLFRRLGAGDVTVSGDEIRSSCAGWVTTDDGTRVKVTVTHVPGPSPAAAVERADTLTGRVPGRA